MDRQVLEPDISGPQPLRTLSNEDRVLDEGVTSLRPASSDGVQALDPVLKQNISNVSGMQPLSQLYHAESKGSTDKFSHNALGLLPYGEYPPHPGVLPQPVEMPYSHPPYERQPLELRGLHPPAYISVGTYGAPRSTSGMDAQGHPHVSQMNVPRNVASQELRTMHSIPDHSSRTDGGTTFMPAYLPRMSSSTVPPGYVIKEHHKPGEYGAPLDLSHSEMMKRHPLKKEGGNQRQFTVAEKLHLVDLAYKYGKREVCTRTVVGSGVLSRWMANRESLAKWKSERGKDSKRVGSVGRRQSFAELSEVLANFVFSEQCAGRKISTASVQQFMKSNPECIAAGSEKILGKSKHAFRGWFDRFKHRMGIVKPRGKKRATKESAGSASHAECKTDEPSTCGSFRQSLLFENLSHFFEMYSKQIVELNSAHRGEEKAIFLAHDERGLDEEAPNFLSARSSEAAVPQELKPQGAQQLRSISKNQNQILQGGITAGSMSSPTPLYPSVQPQVVPQAVRQPKPPGGPADFPSPNPSRLYALGNLVFDLHEFSVQPILDGLLRANDNNAFQTAVRNAVRDAIDASPPNDQLPEPSPTKFHVHLCINAAGCILPPLIAFLRKESSCVSKGCMIHCIDANHKQFAQHVVYASANARFRISKSGWSRWMKRGLLPILNYINAIDQNRTDGPGDVGSKSRSQLSMNPLKLSGIMICGQNVLSPERAKAFKQTGLAIAPIPMMLLDRLCPIRIGLGSVVSAAVRACLGKLQRQKGEHFWNAHHDRIWREVQEGNTLQRSDPPVTERVDGMTPSLRAFAEGFVDCVRLKRFEVSGVVQMVISSLSPSIIKASFLRAGLVNTRWNRIPMHSLRVPKMVPMLACLPRESCDTCQLLQAGELGPQLGMLQVSSDGDSKEVHTSINNDQCVSTHGGETSLSIVGNVLYSMTHCNADDDTKHQKQTSKAEPGQTRGIINKLLTEMHGKETGVSASGSNSRKRGRAADSSLDTTELGNRIKTRKVGN